MLRIWRCDCALCVMETRFHDANHTIPPPPSYEDYPLCPKDKNRSPFHGEKKPDDKMIDIQYSITIIGGREVSKALKKSKRGIFEPLETANCG